MDTISGIFGALGMTSVSITLAVLGRLSWRLGRVTGAARHYIGFYIAALLVGVGVVVRLAIATGVVNSIDLQENVLWVLLYNGAPAAGLTIGVIYAWRYWSWLLAERG